MSTLLIITDIERKIIVERLSHPGEILKTLFLPEYNLTQADLAGHLRVAPGRVSQIINGKRDITPDTARRLAILFNTTERFWLNLQNIYDLSVEKEKNPDLGIQSLQPVS